MRRIYQNTQEIAEDWWGKIKTYKIGEFNSVFSTDEGPISKENSIWRGKFKIGCLMNLLEYIPHNQIFLEEKCLAHDRKPIVMERICDTLLA